jgi:hypothetical protein
MHYFCTFTKIQDGGPSMFFASCDNFYTILPIDSKFDMHIQTPKSYHRPLFGLYQPNPGWWPLVGRHIEFLLMATAFESFGRST